MKKLLRVLSYLVLIGLAFFLWMDAYNWQSHADKLTKAVADCRKYDDYSRCVNQIEVWQTEDGTRVILFEDMDNCGKYLHTVQE
jgi:hypothetical protein